MIKDNLKKLISFKTISVDSHPEEFTKLYQFVDEQLAEFQLVKKEFKKDNFTSLFWGTTENPELLLTAHVDVVPAQDQMFTPKEQDGKLYGRGVLDMKFAIAVFIQIFKSLSDLKDHSIGLLLTPDEETGGFNGTKYVLENFNFQPKVVLLPDGGAQMSIEYAEKGIIHTRVIAKGKSAHGSRPWLGKNAIDTLLESYVQIKNEVPNPDSDQWVTTVNAGKINGGTATNVVPEEASLDLDFRVISEEERQRVKNLLKKLSEENEYISTEIIVEGSSFELDKDNENLKGYLDIAEQITNTRPLLIPSAGSSDARFFSEKKIPVIINRPFGEGHHSENEWIDLESLDQYYKILLNFAKKF